MSRVWVFAAEPDRVQITWHGLDPGPVRFRAGDATAEVEVDPSGGPGAVVLTGLAAGTDHTLEVTSGAGPIASSRFTTPIVPPGDELCRFGAISDLHIGEHRFGYFGTMRDRSGHTDHYPVRATRAALAALSMWGAELLAVKGDITTTGKLEQWDDFAALLAAVDMPALAIPGNHDNRPREHDRRSLASLGMWLLRGGPLGRLLRPTYPGTPIAPRDGLARIGLTLDGFVGWADLPGIRVVVADTTIEHRHLGSFAQVTDQVADAAADARADGRAVWIGGHHYPMTRETLTFWPPGVPAGEAERFFARVAAANPRAFYTAGHTHRNRRYERHGVTCTEVGSPKDFPGTWAGYVVHEGGIRQVSYRVAAPDVLPWLDHSRWAAWGAWGLWSPGTLADRCFSRTW